MSLSLETVDIGELVAESVSDLQHVILRDHHVDVTVSGAPSVRAAPTAAREIVFNLLSNAAKCSSAAAPIDVTVEAVGDMVDVVEGSEFRLSLCLAT